LPAEKAEPVRVLILGTYHFDNPGRDLHNMKVDDVRTPEKQAELADVAARLARFEPNKIAVEAVSERDEPTTKKFDGFTPETLTKNADERVQIAFRLAYNLGQKSVYGIDEQSDKIDYFPYDKVQAYAKAHGKSAMLDDLNAQVGAIISKMEADQKTRSVREMLLEQNRPERIDADHYNFYYALLPLGNNQTQPGADLNGNWYLRNAKFFPSWHRLRSLAIALSSHSVRDIATGCGILSATRRALFWSRRTIICDSSGTLGHNSRSPSSAHRAEIDLWKTRLFIAGRPCGRRCNARFTVT
jgi:hypothetical protein